MVMKWSLQSLPILLYQISLHTSGGKMGRSSQPWTIQTALESTHLPLKSAPFCPNMWAATSVLLVINLWTNKWNQRVLSYTLVCFSSTVLLSKIPNWEMGFIDDATVGGFGRGHWGIWDLIKLIVASIQPLFDILGTENGINLFFSPFAIPSRRQNLDNII